MSFLIQRTLDRSAQADGHSGWAVRKIDYNKLKAATEKDYPHTTEDREMDVEKLAEELTTWLSGLADACMPRNRVGTRRKPAHWWSETIVKLRKDYFKMRRTFQKIRKKYEVVASDATREAYKDSKKDLTNEINRSKEKCWAELCSTIDQDLWGIPYRMVTKKLFRRKWIPGIELPGRLEEIMNVLFPTVNTAMETTTSEMTVGGIQEYGISG